MKMKMKMKESVAMASDLSDDGEGIKLIEFEICKKFEFYFFYQF